MFLLGVSFAAGGGLVYWLGLAKPTITTPPRDRLGTTQGTSTTPEPARTTVVALGRLEPDDGIINVGVSIPDRLEKLLVKEGDEVKAGEELAYLESHDDRLGDRNLADAQLEEARKRLVAIRDAGHAQIKEAEILLEQVQKVEPLEITAQEAKVRALAEQHKSAHAE